MQNSHHHTNGFFHYSQVTILVSLYFPVSELLQNRNQTRTKQRRLSTGDLHNHIGGRQSDGYGGQCHPRAFHSKLKCHLFKHSYPDPFDHSSQVKVKSSFIQTTFDTNAEGFTGS